MLHHVDTCCTTQPTRIFAPWCKFWLYGVWREIFWQFWVARDVQKWINSYTHGFQNMHKTLNWVWGYYKKTKISKKSWATYFEDRQHIFIYACFRKNTSTLHQILRWWKLLSQLWMFKIWINLLKVPEKMQKFKKNLTKILWTCVIKTKQLCDELPSDLLKNAWLWQYWVSQRKI
jgi:hypothetical protein